MIIALIFALVSLAIAVLEAWISAIARWGRGPDFQKSMKTRREEAAMAKENGAEDEKYFSVAETEESSKVYGCVSILCMIVAIVISFRELGFNWFLLTGVALFSMVRALIVAIILLWRGKDTAPLPHCFDIAVTEAVFSSMIIAPSLLGGAITTIVAIF